MKTTALLIALALVSCSAFTDSKDPVTGIRMDAPPEWADTPNPLDTPTYSFSCPPSEGRFGHCWMYR